MADNRNYRPTPGRGQVKPRNLPVDDDIAHGEDDATPAVAPSTADLMAKIEALMAKQAELEQQLAARPVARGAARQAAAPVARTILNYSGKEVTRRSEDATNPFDLPDEFIAKFRERGFDLEWKRVSLYNQPDSAYFSRIQAYGGWEPVKCGEYPGFFGPDDDETNAKPIQMDGVMLMVRPMALTQAARREEALRAAAQINMKHESWGVQSKKPDVFDPDTAKAKEFTLLRKTVEAAPADLQPTLYIDSE